MISAEQKAAWAPKPKGPNGSIKPLRVVLTYESKYGQTHKIAEYCADIVRAWPNQPPHKAHVIHIANVSSAELREADAIIVLTPTYFNRAPKSMRTFLLDHAHELARCPTTALFSVSSKGGSRAISDRTEATTLASDLVRSVGWQPSSIATFGGALAYPKYNLFLRFLAKTMAKRLGGPTDTTRIHEATDWDDVDRAMTRVLTISRELAGDQRAAERQR